MHDLLSSGSTHKTLFFPAGVYISHDLRINQHSGRAVELYLAPGALLQRSGAHLGPNTSWGFISIVNSSQVALRGHGTVDCLDGGSGVYVFGSSHIQLDGWLVRYVHFWNTGIEHSSYVSLKNWKNINAVGTGTGNDNAVVFGHSSHVLWEGGFTSATMMARTTKQIQRTDLIWRGVPQPTLQTSLSADLSSQRTREG
eukprot:COSAG01_NODE_1596_length_9782_cov_16.488692_8_plen_198_part_00